MCVRVWQSSVTSGYITDFTYGDLDAGVSLLGRSHQSDRAIETGGGMDIDGKSSETMRISEFKRGFGGLILPTYSYTVARSTKGLLVTFMLKGWGIEF